eukprot:SAG22_NODE_3_length_48349_cov_158.681180_26_plen_173_part_00
MGAVVEAGACPRLARLYLAGNAIGPAGAAALADVFGSGACPHTTGLVVPMLSHGNDISAAKVRVVEAALAAGPGRHAEFRGRIVAALQRLAVARAVFGPGASNLVTAFLPSVTSMVPGAPERSLLVDAVRFLPVGRLPVASAEGLLQRAEAMAKASSPDLRVIRAVLWRACS